MTHTTHTRHRCIRPNTRGREFLARYGISMTEMAQRLGVSKEWISRQHRRGHQFRGWL